MTMLELTWHRYLVHHFYRMKGISRLTIGPANRYALHPLQNERNKPAYNRTSQQKEIRRLTLTAESTSYFLMVFKNNNNPISSI